MNTGNKIKLLGFQLQTRRAGNTLFKLACSVSLLFSQSKKTRDVLFFLLLQSVLFGCSFINETPYQMTTLEQNALHTCCRVTFNHKIFFHSSSITAGSLCLNIYTSVLKLSCLYHTAPTGVCSDLL